MFEDIQFSLAQRERKPLWFGGPRDSKVLGPRSATGTNSQYSSFKMDGRAPNTTKVALWLALTCW